MINRRQRRDSGHRRRRWGPAPRTIRSSRHWPAFARRSISWPFHDAARPCLADEWIGNVFAAAEKSGAAILATPVVGTLKHVATDRTISETVPRAKACGKLRRRKFFAGNCCSTPMPNAAISSRPTYVPACRTARWAGDDRSRFADEFEDYDPRGSAAGGAGPGRIPKPKFRSPIIPSPATTFGPKIARWLRSPMNGVSTNPGESAPHRDSAA